METLRAIIWGDLSPAGNKISLARQPNYFGYEIEGYNANWVNSGTSALALALIDIKQKTASIASPKVIIPGYCCPDLVAAAVYAGVKPVVVDIGMNDPGYDLDALSEAVQDENIVAIVAINFLGIKERLTEIKNLVQHRTIKVIEDNAQWFPTSKVQHQFLGDYLLFSFGRGKPLSLLGGGVLFSKEVLQVGEVVLEAAPASGVQFLKTHLYNVLLNPHLYCYLNRAPFLRLGETRYHKHEKITAIGSFQQDIFFRNLTRYEQRDRHLEGVYDELFQSSGSQYLSSLQTPRRMSLLRYPLLCESADRRDELLSTFGSLGLGASSLYQFAITEIPLVKELVEIRGELSNAKQFARRLLTMPVHEHVNSRHISQMGKYLAVGA